MSKNDSNQTIMLAAAIVAIALAFNGFAYLRGGSGSGGGDLSGEIEKGIEAYIQKQQAAAQEAQAAANKPQLVEGDFTDDDAMVGDPNAPVTMIEFSDYECPFCKRHFDQVYPQIKEKYVDTGKVKVIFRDFPLSFHPNAEPAAIAAECVGEQLGDAKYFEYHDKLFANNTNLTAANLKSWAEELGANGSSFDNCINDEATKAEVQADLADGQKAGITGTPGFLINNKRISGAQPFSAFESAIEEALNN